METILSWSGGKDSTASIILAHEHNLPLDEILYAEVMFDNSRGISGENPEQIKWIDEVAIPKIRSWGYKVTKVRSDTDYVSLYYKKIKRSKIAERNGKIRGFPQGRACFMLDYLKLIPMKRYKKNLGEITEVLGIAADEPKRLERMHVRENNISYLEMFNYSEEMAFDLCNKYGMLSPIYKTRYRGGCWFCPNARDKERLELRQNHPELWNELLKLNKDSNKAVSPLFCYGRTLKEVNADLNRLERQQKLEESQISIFDLI